MISTLRGLNLSGWTIRQTRVLAMAVLALALVLPYFMLALTPDIEQKQSWCPVKLMTGLPCPGCGMLKSWCFLTHGDLWHSLLHHPLGAIAYLFSIAAFIWAAVEYRQNKVIPLPWQGQASVVYWVGGLVAIIHIARLSYLVIHPAMLLEAWQSGYFYKFSVWLAGVL